LGPADGHNIKEVCKLLKIAKELSKPTIIHLTTTKGKGYKFAEENPESFHGVSCFNVKNGESSEAEMKNFASAFGEAMLELADEDRRICAITAAMKSGTGLDDFAGRYKDRFFDVGIAEGHAVTMAGGLSKQGMIPVCAIYSTFVQRAYDMIFHDICLQGQHVIFAVDRAGLVGEDGQTHQGIYDVGIFLQMPNMTVLCPSGLSEMKHMLRYAIYEQKGPVAIRYPRGGYDAYASQAPPYEPMVLRKGREATIVTYGRLVENAMGAAELLDRQNIAVTVIKLIEISNLSADKLTALSGDAGMIFVIEECVSSGSVASKLTLESSANGNHSRIIPINLGKAIVPPASTKELMHMYSLDAESIADTIAGAIKKPESILRLLG